MSTGSHRGIGGGIQIPRRLRLIKLRHPQLHKLARELANLHGSRVEFLEIGDRLATLSEFSLNFPCASYLDIIQCIPNGKMSQCYINIANILEMHLLQKPREAVMGQQQE